MGTAENEPMRLLLLYLTTSHYEHGERVTPLEKSLRQQLDIIVREIAREVIDSAPGLREMIKENANAALNKAMNTDEWLRKRVVDAVAKSIGSYVLEHGDDD